MLLGAACFFLLPDTPAAVRGLTPCELAALEADLAAETADGAARRSAPPLKLLGAVLKTKYTPLLAIMNFVAGTRRRCAAALCIGAALRRRASPCFVGFDPPLPLLWCLCTSCNQRRATHHC